MITVSDGTETTARIKYAFDHGRVPVPKLCDPNLTMRIDAKTMDAVANGVAHSVDEGGAKLSKVDVATIRRETVNTVAQKGKHGEQMVILFELIGLLLSVWGSKHQIRMLLYNYF